MLQIENPTMHHWEACRDEYLNELHEYEIEHKSEEEEDITNYGNGGDYKNEPDYWIIEKTDIFEGDKNRTRF